MMIIVGVIKHVEILLSLIWIIRVETSIRKGSIVVLQLTMGHSFKLGCISETSSSLNQASPSLSNSKVCSASKPKLWYQGMSTPQRTVITFYNTTITNNNVAVVLVAVTSAAVHVRSSTLARVLQPCILHSRFSKRQITDQRNQSQRRRQQQQSQRQLIACSLVVVGTVSTGQQYCLALE